MNDRNEYSGFSYAQYIRLYLTAALAICTPSAGMAFALAEQAFTLHSAGGIAYLVAGLLASLVAFGAGFYYWKAADSIFSMRAKLVLAVFTVAAIWGVFQFYLEFSLVFVVWIGFWAFIASLAVPSFSFNVCAGWSRHEFGVPVAAGIILYFMLDFFKYGVPTANVGVSDMVFGIIFAVGILLLVTILLGALSHIVVLIACAVYLITLPDQLIISCALSMALVWTPVFFGGFLAIVASYFFFTYEFEAFAKCRTAEKGRDLIKRFQEGYVPDFSMFRLEGWT